MRRRDFLTGISTLGWATLSWQRRPSAAEPAANQSICEIGSRVEMFVDRYLLEQEKNVDLRLHTPERREVVLTLNQPWEGASSAYYTVMPDGDVIRLYYRASASYQGGQQPPVSFCYAESRDGIHFERPSLGLFEFAGSTANNIIFRDEIAQDSFVPLRDTNPNADPQAQYKALVSAAGALYAAASPDGLHWRWLQKEPVTRDGSFDSLNLAYWDANQQQYRMFSRYLDVPGRMTNEQRNRAVWSEGTNENWVRAIQSSTSKDFIHWQPAQPHAYTATAPREHFYTNATIPCPGADHMLLSFPKRFIESRRVVPADEHESPGVSDAMLMSSRDGHHWDRTFLEAWVRPGSDRRNWTQRSNMIAWGIVETSSTEFSLYISEHYEWPDNRLRRLVIRRHGFASVHAGVPGGDAITKPLLFTGRQLLINFASSAGGSVRVELEDTSGNAIAGYSLDDCDAIYGDEICRPVTWRGKTDVSTLVGKPIKVRFHIQDADLYTFQFV